MANLDRDDRLWLFGEHNAAIQERWDNVMYQDVNPSLVIFLEILIVVDSLYGSTTHHTVDLPRLVILRHRAKGAGQ